MNIDYLDIITEDDTYDFIFTNYEDEYKISIELLYNMWVSFPRKLDIHIIVIITNMIGLSS